jgi:uncharacterized membrane protein/phosphopantetheine adenylyltransferase
LNDTNLRSIIKALSWRLTGTIDTFIVSFFVTGELLIAGSIASIEILTKIVLFWMHERVWNNVKWGRFTKPTAYPVGFDWRKETVQMLGRWQPWHAGHRALFDRAIAKTGQVCIMIRDCEGWHDSNPFKREEVENFIHADLKDKYEGKYIIVFVPNITNITYGRNVGYKIENEVFDEDTHSISATEIRKQMGLK